MTEHKITINPLCKGKFLPANDDSYLVWMIIAAFLITLHFHTISEDFWPRRESWQNVFLDFRQFLTGQEKTSQKHYYLSSKVGRDAQKKKR